jgi:predicted MFS family arabinose efflux permease
MKAIESTSRDRADSFPGSRHHAWIVFGILFALMVVDYVDRQIVVSMFPHLKAQWALSDGQLAGLVSVVAATVALGTVPISLLADRWSRVKSIFLMVLVWSAATIASAFASGYAELLAARAVVGIGEAAYGAVGAALLASLFPSRMRSTILGAFLSASLVGSVLGVALGGVIAQRYGWEMAFGLAGAVGLLLALLFIGIVRDREPGDRENQAQIGSLKSVAAALLRPRTMLVTCIAGGLQLVMVAAIYAWMPSLLHRGYAMAPDVAGLTTAALVVCGGIGALLCGMLADRLGARRKANRLHVPAAVAALTAALMWTAFTAFPAGAVQFALIVAGATVMTGTIGPAAAVVVDVVEPALRGTAASILALTQNLLGLAAGPLLTGLLSDRYGLAFALSVAPLFCIGAACAFVIAARTYESDLREIDVRRHSSDDELRAAAA